MSREINIAKNVQNLRKKNHITQDQLAAAINVSPQAVSKWENGICQPDTLMVPQIADFFHVSIDYLFYGQEEVYDEIYDLIINRVTAITPGTEEQYEETLKLSLAIQEGILRGAERNSYGGPIPLMGIPIHLMDIHGFSLSSPRGFSTVVTDDFVNSINRKTMKRANRIFQALANEDCLRVTMEILNLNGISSLELKSKTGFDDDRLKEALEIGYNAGFIEATKSIHQVLEMEYYIQRHHLNPILLLLSTIKMIEISLMGSTRIQRHPGFSMTYDCEENFNPPTEETSTNEPQ